MAGSKASKSRSRTKAKKAATSPAAVRERVRELSVSAMRDRDMSLRDVPKLVNEVLEGAAAGVDKSIPSAKKNVLREVFEGLRDGVHAVALAGSGAAKGVRDRGREVMGKDAAAAAKRIKTANDEFLGAVRSFADKASKGVREELDALVDRAEKTGPKVSASAKRIATAADGRWAELGGETVRAGGRMVRGAAETIAMGAGGFFEGLAEALGGRSTQARGTDARVTPRTSKRATRRGGKKTAKKPVRSRSSTRRS